MIYAISNTFCKYIIIVGEYINEDGELALAYETQKTINKQLELELQDEKAKYKAHEKEYKLEIEKLRSDNERQQRILAENLNNPPQSQNESFMQHEITRLTSEYLDMQEKNKNLSDSVKKLKIQLKYLKKKLKEVGMEVDDTVLDKPIELIENKYGRDQFSIMKKERDYQGMFSFKTGTEKAIMKALVSGM